MTMAAASLEVFEYSPNAIKKSVTGVTGADKNQVEQMVRLILGLQDAPSSDHAADALGAAICCAASLQAGAFTAATLP